MIEWLQKDIGRYLDLPVRIMNNTPIPEESFDRSRNQYHSTKILKEIIAEIPRDVLKILGIIDRDIMIPILTFVFGEAQLGGSGALVSLTRLRQEFYGLQHDAYTFYERLHKESLHELGHTFGLIHCPIQNCIMHFSNTVLDVDRKGNTFCRDCYSALALKRAAEGEQNG